MDEVIYLRYYWKLFNLNYEAVAETQNSYDQNTQSPTVAE